MSLLVSRWASSKHVRNAILLLCRLASLQSAEWPWKGHGKGSASGVEEKQTGWIGFQLQLKERNCSSKELKNTKFKNFTKQDFNFS